MLPGLARRQPDPARKTSKGFGKSYSAGIGTASSWPAGRRSASDEGAERSSP